ncbi:DNA ligase D [Candidatus Parcubacteria bacterium]|nr:MAG: DNA ligase D [Candidatus Parcubacteria bacterium]
MILEEYGRKRNFKKTREPAAKPVRPKVADEYHFVIQKHSASRLHYDFRIEADGVLKSWAVPKGPSMNPADKRLAMMVEDHPLDYRSFEGVIPEGNYGAGPVIVWDEGTYEIKSGKGKTFDEKVLDSINKGRLTIILAGKKLQGEFALAKMARGGDNAWLMIKKRDEYADENIKFDERSVKSGRTVEEVETEEVGLANSEESPPEPASVKPMFAKLADRAFDKKDWIFEPKRDGYRALAFVSGGKAKLYSRKNVLLNEDYPTVASSFEVIKEGVVLDGEIVALNDEGKPDFQTLQDYRRDRKGQVIYFVFDLLFLNGRDVRRLALKDRRELLRLLFSKYDLASVKLSDYVEEKGQRFFEAIRRQGLEGMMAKNLNSPYRSGARSADWLKIKTEQRQEAVIAGFTLPRAGQGYFGALVLGVYENNNLRYIGHVGTGFDSKTAEELYEKMSGFKREDSPFIETPQTNEPAVWLEPQLVCEIKFREWTKDGVMRQPVFIGLREDKDPKEVVREFSMLIGGEPRPRPRYYRLKEKEEEIMIDGKKLILTNLDKVYWPKDGYTKKDLVNYYDQIAPHILPYIKDRPETMHRFPEGIEKPAFYHKDIDKGISPDWLETVDIRAESEKKKISYLLCQNRATLIYMANLGCIEIHPWLSRYFSPDSPDHVVIDLDPLEVDFDKVLAVALEVKKVMDELRIFGLCKTSGAKGLHIYIPLKENYTYEQGRNFAEIIANMTYRRIPEITSLERLPDRRRGRVYLDYLQNVKGQTVAAPYSVRPLDGAPVSTPLVWKELSGKIKPSDFNIFNIRQRIEKKGDPWREILEKKNDISAAIERIERQRLLRIG